MRISVRQRLCSRTLRLGIDTELMTVKGTCRVHCIATWGNLACVAYYWGQPRLFKAAT